MCNRLQWTSIQVARQLWFRTTIFSVLAVAVALLGVVIEPDIPPDVTARIGTEAVGTLLDILAASMLPVIIFSMSTVVSAHATATSNATPRATRVLSEDNVAQNALGTFIGAFIFSLVGIIALQPGLYDERGQVTLYAVTLVVLAVIVLALLRWIDHVSSLGRVGAISDRVESRTAEVLRQHHACPHLAATPLPAEAGVPAGAVALHAERSGYVENIDVQALHAAAEAAGVQVYVTALPGTFADASRPLACTSGPVDATCKEAMRTAFTVGGARSFDQDPRFGLIVLAEIAVRALSPGVNDPGTAIDVLGRAGRLLALRAGPAPEGAGRVDYPAVHVPEVQLADLFEDILVPIARDGAGMSEVAVRLQDTLRGLASLGDPRVAELATRHAAMALERAERALDFEPDRERVRRAALWWREHDGARPRHLDPTTSNLASPRTAETGMGNEDGRDREAQGAGKGKNMGQGVANISGKDRHDQAGTGTDRAQTEDQRQAKPSEGAQSGDS